MSRVNYILIDTVLVAAVPLARNSCREPDYVMCLEYVSLFGIPHIIIHRLNPSTTRRHDMLQQANMCAQLPSS